MMNEEAILGLREIKEAKVLPSYIEEPMGIEGVVINTDEMIDFAIKALEIEERPKGKWITHSDYPDRLICSNCNHKYDVWFIDNGTNFCPNCGADMRGDV